MTDITMLSAASLGCKPVALGLMGAVEDFALPGGSMSVNSTYIGPQTL